MSRSSLGRRAILPLRRRWPRRRAFAVGRWFVRWLSFVFVCLRVVSGGGVLKETVCVQDLRLVRVALTQPRSVVCFGSSCNWCKNQCLYYIRNVRSQNLPSGGKIVES